MQNTLYDILGIKSTATKEEIKLAFKFLAKKFHPDKNPTNFSYEERFKEINHAYQVLSNEISKQKYDYQLEYIAFQKKKPSSSTTQKKKPPIAPNQKRTTASNAEMKKKNSSLNTNLFVLGFFTIMGVLTYFVYTFMSKYTAEDLFEKAEILSTQGRHKEAFMLYTDALSYYKEYPEAYEKRGTARILSIKDYNGAERDFTNAIIYAEKPTTSLYFKRVKCHIKLKQFNQALVDLDSIVSINPNEDSAYYYKAEINYTQDNFQSAITNYTTFIQVNPNVSDAYLKRGYCYLKSNDYSNALTDFNTIISLNPQENEAYYYRGITYLSLNDHSKACSDLNYSYIIGFSDAKDLIEKYCSKQ